MASGPRVKLASCKSALNPTVVYSTDRSKAVVPMLDLLFVALWFILRDDLFYVLPCVILFLFSVLLALRWPRLGKRELILVLFVRFVLVWFCRFALPLGVWEGLRFVIVALPGLFSYPPPPHPRFFKENKALMFCSCHRLIFYSFYRHKLLLGNQSASCEGKHPTIVEYPMFRCLYFISAMFFQKYVSCWVPTLSPGLKPSLWNCIFA